MTSAAVSAAPLRLVRPAPAPLAIEVAHVTKRFGQQEALSGVTLAVEPGQIHALLGPNGAGKTTAPADPERAGDTGRRQRAAERRRPAAQPASSWVSSRPATAPSTSGSRRSRTSSSSAACTACGGVRRSSRARAGLEAVGLAGEERKRAGLLSKGMQRRLALARALLCDPAILLIDEATHDLDPDGRAARTGARDPRGR